MSEVARRPTRRVGHKGAGHIALGNTLASFDAGLAAGVDMIEFDVLSERPDGTGRLVLAHDYHDTSTRSPLTLEAGLAHFASDAYAGVELDVDLKLKGYEDRVVVALREHGLTERTLISTMETESLRVVRALEPELRQGWSVPKVRRNYLAHRATRPAAWAAIAYARRSLPPRLAAAIQSGQIDAVMAHWSLVSAGFWRTIREVGGELYVWTVDDAERIAALEALGVSGIISNDPRLFDVPSSA